MKTSLIKIGNSRGIRIPKPIFVACGFENEVELEVKDNALIIRSERKARSGWSEAFQSMRQQGDDALIDEDAWSQSSQWDANEWEWQ
jgi:antitoxin MazE